MHPILGSLSFPPLLFSSVCSSGKENPRVGFVSVSVLSFNPTTVLIASSDSSVFPGFSSLSVTQPVNSSLSSSYLLQTIRKLTIYNLSAFFYGSLPVPSDPCPRFLVCAHGRLPIPRSSSFLKSWILLHSTSRIHISSFIHNCFVCALTAATAARVSFGPRTDGV